MSEGTTAAEFAALLGELKERSGLSYGVLAKRLHMSTSTLHRYCNGDAVPTDYAPVERLARLCKASSEELVELHRRWVLADAARARKGSGATGGGGKGSRGGESRGEGSGGEESRGEGSAGEGSRGEESGRAGDGVPVSGAVVAADGVPVSGAVVAGDTDAPAPEAPARRRPRRALLVGVAVAVALTGVGLAVAVPLDGSDDGGRGGTAVVSSGAGGGPAGDGPAASVRPSAGSSTPGGEDKHRAETKHPGRGGGKDEGKKEPAASDTAAGGSGRPGRDTAPAAAPLTVTTEPHAWESPCSQRYLVNLPPGQVRPPPIEPDAPGWVAAMGAVPSGEQLLKLTVQGKGEETVVVKDLTVRMAGKRAPLAWNDYAMGYPGVGCGGGVPTRFFTVALDATRPGVVPEAGHADFPFKVSESDPEVYYIQADASAYDVSWYLELTWSSGGRTGTLIVDDHGRPFRTSGNNGRPAYEFPLGGEKWVEEGTTQ
ncbi:helix-turn-helix domain-containing protein [Streptomyces sp. NPDC059696]|uniref:helix-turn-helix domain-containing protein n=1 Tax=Streptomyces sp. NPDC059696 TaxID=3346911 RepID=UPI00367E035F